jgi:hypothetical protein
MLSLVIEKVVNKHQEAVVDCGRQGSQNPHQSTSRSYQFSRLCRNPVLSTFYACLLCSFSSCIKSLFISLKTIVLPIINIVYKDNNKINISYLLLIKDVI